MPWSRALAEVINAHVFVDGRNWGTQRKPTQIRGEDANSTQTGPGFVWDSNSALLAVRQQCHHCAPVPLGNELAGGKVWKDNLPALIVTSRVC